ncbi:MAG: phosphoribosyltransferase [Ktedonobacterales bacterium]
MVTQFRDRTEAGQLLANKIMRYANRDDVLVLGLPRGGVQVAFEIARALNAPLDVMVVRKLGVPGEEELAMGAIGPGGTRVLNADVIRMGGISDSAIDAVTRQEQQELERRIRRYRGNRPPPEMRGRVVILVDDGIATGATMRAAIAAVRRQQPARIIVAAPVAAAETCEALRQELDEVICLLDPEVFWGVGVWYQHFPQLTDDEVQALLALAWQSHPPPPADQHHEHGAHP